MSTRLRKVVRGLLPLCAGLAGLTAPAGAGAQVVPLRTVPIPAGEQFVITPSRAQGMGGAYVALDDPWQDPFINPAKGARNERLRVFALPAVYAADGAGGGGVTLAGAALARSGRWFGGAGGALQSPDDPNRGNFNQWWGPIPLGAATCPADVTAPSNRYGYALLGRTLGAGRTSLGVGISGASLQQVDGVERLLRDNRTWIREAGSTLDLRAGALRELAGGGSLEVLALYSRLDFSYDVGRLRWLSSYVPGTATTPPVYKQWTQAWVDHNRDVSRTYGLHLRWLRAPDSAGWRLGYIATLNHKRYPVLPNYDVAPVPRDPGVSWAGQAGIGVSRDLGKRTTAMEFVLEPAWSHTWATSPAVTDSVGRTTPEAVTSENWFHFFNAHAVWGSERRTDWGAYRYGLRMDEIHYSLSRQDFQRPTGNVESNDGWFEWTPTWGVSFRAGPVDIQYAGHFSFHGIDLGMESKTVIPPSAPMDSPDVLPPAVGSSSRNFWTAAHQLTISLPVGSARR